MTFIGFRVFSLAQINGEKNVKMIIYNFCVKCENLQEILAPLYNETITRLMNESFALCQWVIKRINTTGNTVTITHHFVINF